MGEGAFRISAEALTSECTVYYCVGKGKKKPDQELRLFVGPGAVVPMGLFAFLTEEKEFEGLEDVICLLLLPRESGPSQGRYSLAY